MARGKYEAAREKTRLSYRSYIISLICLALCCVLFVGSTFAWFSVSVSSNANQIYVGSLQVELLHHENGQQIPVTANHAVFDNAFKWKPESAQAEVLTVVNKGNIAFGYELQLAADLANSVLNNSQSFYDVAQYFDVFACSGESRALTDAGWQYVGSLAQVVRNEVAVFEGDLKNTDDADTFSIALVLRSDASTQIMGQQLSFHVKLIANQDGYVDYQKAGTAQELTAALAASEAVQLTANISAPAAEVAHNGTPYGFKLDGGLLDGAGHALTVSGSGEIYGILTNGGTIQNLTIDGGFRSITLVNPQEDLILENLTVVGSGVGYSISTAEPGAPVKLVARNSTFAGWASFEGLESAVLTDCTFQLGSYWGGTTYDRVIKPFGNTTFDGCSFTAQQYIDLSQLANGCKVTFKNCKVNGTALTAENWLMLFETIELPTGRTVSDCVVFQ